MVVQRIRAELLSVPELASWPEIVRLIERPTKAEAMPCWELPVRACRAVGGTAGEALPGAAAIFCLLYSIHLVDDLLDSDPKGLQHTYGDGRVANFALAFHAASSIVIEKADLTPECRAAAHGLLAGAGLATAYGQNLDLAELQGEEDYWKVVEAKTPPLFAAALSIGGLLGSASTETVQSLGRLGFLLGKSIQISDDLNDAFERPPAPDWFRKQNNLPILYAMTAEHPERARFLELLSRIDEDGSLEEAQEILVRSGAVSFCAYHMIELNRAAKRLLVEMSLPDLLPLQTLVEHYIKPLTSLLRRIGVDSLEDLIK
jgi:geranylgeranyl pyrophosphate synthase